MVEGRASPLLKVLLENGVGKPMLYRLLGVGRESYLAWSVLAPPSDSHSN